MDREHRRKRLISDHVNSSTTQSTNNKRDGARDAPSPVLTGRRYSPSGLLLRCLFDGPLNFPVALQHAKKSRSRRISRTHLLFLVFVGRHG